MLIDKNYTAPLSKDVVKAFNQLMHFISAIPLDVRSKKNIDFTHDTVDIADLIAYQIGWGNLLINWYKVGLQCKIPSMPGEGFVKWDYNGLAKHFYKKYRFDAGIKQERTFRTIVEKILTIIEHEYQTKNLQKEGVWDWCTLSSGKKWPLSKWIMVNTVAPYKRARSLIRKMVKK